MKKEDEQACLLKLGINENDIALINKYQDEEDYTKMIMIFNSYRNKALDKIHDEYKNLECLDYIISGLKKKGEQKNEK